MDINLGDIAEDTITGFKGTVIAKTAWITGCDRITLQPKVDKDGKVPDHASFDITSIKVLKSVKPKKKVATGGPRPEPVKK